MSKKQDKETRYYIDLDLKNNKVIKIEHDQRENIVQELPNSSHQRVFITKGQYNKLVKKEKEI